MFFNINQIPALLPLCLHITLISGQRPHEVEQKERTTISGNEFPIAVYHDPRGQVLSLQGPQAFSRPTRSQTKGPNGVLQLVGKEGPVTSSLPTLSGFDQLRSDFIRGGIRVAPIPSEREITAVLIPISSKHPMSVATFKVSIRTIGQDIARRQEERQPIYITTPPDPPTSVSLGCCATPTSWTTWTTWTKLLGHEDLVPLIVIEAAPRREVGSPIRLIYKSGRYQTPGRDPDRSRPTQAPLIPLASPLEMGRRSSDKSIEVIVAEPLLVARLRAEGLDTGSDAEGRLQKDQGEGKIDSYFLVAKPKRTVNVKNRRRKQKQRRRLKARANKI
ncbi:hypothetical protein TWF730_000090 [Orbilia blumenaviensis]|uniref:Mitochondrial mRNA-processing protein COX24 C-terminal domain-containing protein n=1 Tax=Orbilia blumenaviensis TaxID=1796055 RepID=A0AAV9VNB8_9PEZI